MTGQQVAELLQVPPRTLEEWRQTRTGRPCSWRRSYATSSTSTSCPVPGPRSAARGATHSWGSGNVTNGRWPWDDVRVVSEKLEGGRWTAHVVRDGDLVHRSHGARSDRAAAILTALEQLGYPFSPRYRGRDADGNDVVSFVPGVTTNHPTQRAESSYAEGARMLRLLHDLTAGHELAGDAECIVHGDAGPFNTIFDEAGMPIAFIDWDSAQPGQRLPDLAYLGWTWCIQAAGSVDLADQARRLASVRDAYGLHPQADLLGAVIDQQSEMIRTSTDLLRNPGHDDPYYQRVHATIEWAAADRNVVLQNRLLFESALAR